MRGAIQITTKMLLLLPVIISCVKLCGFLSLENWSCDRYSKTPQTSKMLLRKGSLTCALYCQIVLQNTVTLCASWETCKFIALTTTDYSISYSNYLRLWWTEDRRLRESFRGSLFSFFFIGSHLFPVLNLL